MKRRSFRVIGADGTYDVEIERIEGGSLEVQAVNDMGIPMGGAVIVHEWQAAKVVAADMIRLAVVEGRV